MKCCCQAGRKWLYIEKKVGVIQLDAKKRKFTLYAPLSFYARIDAACASDNCQSKNEFVIKAVEFYLSYLAGEDSMTALVPILTSIVQSAVTACEERLARNIFKLAVEQAKTSNLLAVMQDLDDDTLRRLHIKCVDEVRRTNGIMRLEDAVKYQRG